MNDELRELYQDVIIEHSKRPRNFHADGRHGAEGRRLQPAVRRHGAPSTSTLDGDVVRDVAFQGHGCAISTASASVMTETLKGKTRAEAEELFRDFHDLVTGNADAGSRASSASSPSSPASASSPPASSAPRCAGTPRARRWKEETSRSRRNEAVHVADPPNRRELSLSMVVGLRSPTTNDPVDSRRTAR